MLSLVVPVYNEEDVIKATIDETVKELEKQKIKFEIILVDNGSTDNSGKAIKMIEDKRIKKVFLKANQTFGGGVIEGLKHAKGDYLGITCAGGKVPAGEIGRLYKILLDNRIDYIKGDRMLKYQSKTRIILSVLYGAMARSLFSLKVSDINGYPIIMKRKAYKKINPQIRDWIFNVEMLHKANKNGFKVLSVPVRHRARLAGKSHIGMQVVFDMFIGLLKYRLKN